jgi:hypothetical protein
MKSEHQIRRLARQIRIEPDCGIDQRVLAAAEGVLAKSTENRGVMSPRRPSIWSIIMKNTLTRIAAAAVIIVGLGMVVFLIDKATAPAWAVDQSIRAMKNYRGVHLSGMVTMSWTDAFRSAGVKDLPELPESRGEFEIWAQADEGLSRSSRVKMILPDNVVISGRKLQTYMQLADGTTYDIQGDHMKIQPWPTSALLEVMKDVKDTWTELRGMDGDTGRERVYIKCSSADMNKSWKFEFDSESKLLVSLKQWANNNSHEGPPTLDIRKIVYFEQLPDEIFEIDLPDPSKIISVNTPLYDPDYGMSAEGLTRQQACRKILTEFWQRVSKRDFDGIRKLFPYSANWSDEVLRINIGYDRGPVELLEIGPVYGTEIGPAAPCTVQLKDEKIVVDMIVMFREIDGKSSCIVHSNKGKSRPVKQ